jgi:hypothetical protein
MIPSFDPNKFVQELNLWSEEDFLSNLQTKEKVEAFEKEIAKLNENILYLENQYDKQLKSFVQRFKQHKDKTKSLATLAILNRISFSFSQMSDKLGSLSPKGKKVESASAKAKDLFESKSVGDSGAIVRPFRDNSLNRSEVNGISKWISLHSTQAHREALEILTDPKKGIRHISQTEFEKVFVTKTLKEFNSLMDEGEAYVTIIEKGKSNKWMADLAKPHLKVLPKEEATTDYASYLKSKEDDFPKTIVFFDDATYSGEQLKDRIGRIHGAITRKNAEIDLQNQSISDSALKKSKILMPHIIIAVPFMTKVGEEKLKDAAKELQMKLSVLDHEVIPTIADIFKDNPKELEVLRAMYWPTYKGRGDEDPGIIKKSPENCGSVWFDHKVPDDVSFPMEIAQGIVIDEDPEEIDKKKIVLIPKTVTPYGPLFKELKLKWEKAEGSQQLP